MCCTSKIYSSLENFVGGGEGNGDGVGDGNRDSNGTMMVESGETATLAPSRMRQETRARARERAKPKQ